MTLSEAAEKYYKPSAVGVDATTRQEVDQCSNWQAGLAVQYSPANAKKQDGTRALEQFRRCPVLPGMLCHVGGAEGTDRHNRELNTRRRKSKTGTTAEYEERDDE